MYDAYKSWWVSHGWVGLELCIMFEDEKIYFSQTGSITEVVGLTTCTLGKPCSK